MDRREFLKHIGGAAVATSVVLSACKNNNGETPIAKDVIDGQGEMTYRTNPNTGDKVSLLGRFTREAIQRPQQALHFRAIRATHTTLPPSSPTSAHRHGIRKVLRPCSRTHSSNYRPTTSIICSCIASVAQEKT